MVVVVEAELGLYERHSECSTTAHQRTSLFFTTIFS
jgi:hypothetical protein